MSGPYRDSKSGDVVEVVPLKKNEAAILALVLGLVLGFILSDQMSRLVSDSCTHNPHGYLIPESPYEGCLAMCQEMDDSPYFESELQGSIITCKCFR